MKCQFLVHHDGGFNGYYERCLNRGKFWAVTTPQGSSVRVCTIHKKFVFDRDKMGMNSPDQWFEGVTGS